jgi:hypothetical protein
LRCGDLFGVGADLPAVVAQELLNRLHFYFHSSKAATTKSAMSVPHALKQAK